MEDKKNKRFQMAFDIDPIIRQKIKIIAARKNISMNLYVMRAIQDKLKKDLIFDEEDGKEWLG